MDATETGKAFLRRAIQLQAEIGTGASGARDGGLVSEGPVDNEQHPAELASPHVFISWAHKNVNWSDSEAQNWQTQVADFAATLVRLGIDADVDLFHLDEAVDWTRFGSSGIQSADKTLVVMSIAWAERWSGTNSPFVGAGAAVEADTLRGLFIKNQEKWQRDVVIVMFPDVDSDIIPPDLERVSRLYVDLSDPDSMENVLRLLTGQPRFPKPNLGHVARLGSVEPRGATGETVSDLRVKLVATTRELRRLKSASTAAAIAERESLAAREATLRGFIDAALKEGD